ncbi:MAG TPA: hypothetical protein VJ782_03540 [Aeromicrobium sp.]|nr:hypothetical protein [Aeromicrobium sp.]
MGRFRLGAQSLSLAFAVSLSLAACGGSEKSPSPDGAATQDAPPSASAELSQSNFADDVFSAIEKAGSAKIHFESGTGGKKFIGEGEVEYGDELAVRMTMPNPAGGSGKQEMLLIGDTVYMGMGDRYMSMSMDAMRSSGMPDMSASLDPKAQKDAFEAAITDFKQSGEPETLDGVQATPYVITLDPKKAPETFGSVVTEPLTFTYFVGPDNLPRKMVYEDKNGEFVATYTDWGADVDIEAPPADKVMQGMR